MGPPRPPVGRRPLGLALSAAAALALLLVVELVLRAVGAAPSASTLRYQRVHPPLFRPARLPDGRAVLATVDPRLPFQWVDPGEDDVLRVACFGGSATAGLGLSPNATFARELERLLAEQHPDRPVEVLNLGVVALASTQVRRLVEDVCARVPLDAVVVYSGNNEFLELHSLRFAALRGGGPSALARALSVSALVATLRGPEPEPDPATLEASITTRHLAANDARVTHTEMLGEVRLTAGEVERVFDRYEQNLRAMAAAARRAGVPLLLCTVAANERWTGVEDESDEWLATLGLEPEAPHWSAALDGALARAEAAADPVEAWRWLTRAARAAEAAGAGARAAELYARALDADPHLRRATPRHGERVRRVAGSEAGVTLVDLERLLRGETPDGVVGFETFYDYVHFTPEGALRTAERLGAALVAAGVVEHFEADAPHARARRAFLASEAPDALEVGDFIGFGPDRALLASRSLWRYDALVDRLDAAIDADPGDWRARCWRGNVHFFRPLHAAEAEADYRAALAIVDEPRVRANLARLTSDRRP